jgi:hypothetical protein
MTSVSLSPGMSLSIYPTNIDVLSTQHNAGGQPTDLYINYIQAHKRLRDFLKAKLVENTPPPRKKRSRILENVL